MKTLIQNLFHRFTSWWRERWHLSLELMALRHQVKVLKRSGKRPQFASSDRCFWLLLSSWWSKWPQALEIMQADTVRRWERQGIWHHLMRRRGRKRPGRPPIPAETRKLIREISRDNRLWGAKRLHGELAKLGIKASRTTVAKYMIRRRYPPSPTGRTFIRNQTPEFFGAEVYAELSSRFRAVQMQCLQVLRRRFRWLFQYLQHPVRDCHVILRTGRSDLVSAPVARALGMADPVKMSGRSPPGFQPSSTDSIFNVHADDSTEIGMADVRPNSSGATGGAVPPRMSHTIESHDNEQRMKGSHQAAA